MRIRGVKKKDPNPQSHRVKSQPRYIRKTHCQAHVIAKLENKTDNLQKNDNQYAR